MEQFRRRYIRYLKLERNYTANTIEAYTHDLDYLLNFMRCENLSVYDIRLSHLETFAATIHEFGVSATSQARILSGIRAFFRFLVLDGVLTDDPAELLESPSIGEHLPEVLSTEEVDRMERAIDLSKWEGQRNRAIIEVLFSCGLRVSELINLRFSDISVKNKFLRIVGKGDKERLVPISDTECCQRCGHHQDCIATHATPLVCHCSTARRRQPSCHTGNAWTREYQDYTDIHPHRHHHIARRDSQPSSSKYEEKQGLINDQNKNNAYYTGGYTPCNRR